MTARLWSVVVCSMFYCAAAAATETPDEWGILPSDVEHSLIYYPDRASGAGANDPLMPFGAIIIPFETFNEALMHGRFTPTSNVDLLRFAYGTAGSLNDPTTLGLRAVIVKATEPELTDGGISLSIGTNVYIVVSDARYIPESDDEIEATQFFVVAGRLEALDEDLYYMQTKTAWYSFTNPPYVFADNGGNHTPMTFPTTCCNTDTFTFGAVVGYRCINPATSRNTAATPEATLLPMGHAQDVPLYVLRDPNAYAGAQYDNDSFKFSDPTHPPANFSSAVQCLSCTRTESEAPYGCSTPIACVSDDDCTSLESCRSGVCMLEARNQCLSDGDCNFGQSCVRGACVRTFAAANAGCTVDADCPKKQKCNGKTGQCYAPAANHQDPPPQGADPYVVAPGSVELVGGGIGPVSVNYGVDEEDEEIDVELDLIDFGLLVDTAESMAQVLNGHRACPDDEDVTAYHCLDPNFMESPCGQRYSPADMPPHYAPAGPLPTFCDELIAAAIRNGPKRNPIYPVLDTETVCRQGVAVVNNVNDVPQDNRPQAYQPKTSNARDTNAQQAAAVPVRPNAQQPGNNVSLTGDVESAAVQFGHDNDDGYTTECTEEYIGDPPAYQKAYQRLFNSYSTLYKLDGRHLGERELFYMPFQWDTDVNFDRNSISYEGGTDTASAQTRRDQALLIRERQAALNAIEERKNRWSGATRPREMRDCREYVFQRFYEHELFLEKAALLGSNDWAIWDLAFGPANEPTSIGTHMLDEDYGPPKSYLNDRVGGFKNFYAAARFPGNTRSGMTGYFKNVYFSLILPQALLNANLDFAYKDLLKVGQEESGEDAGIMHPDFRHLIDWNYHYETGRALRDRGITLKQFDHFAAYELPAFVQARNRLYRAIVDAMRDPNRANDMSCSGCGCNYEEQLLPVHSSAETGNRFAEWIDHSSTWSYFMRESDGGPMIYDRVYENGNAGRCPVRVTNELRNALRSLDRLMTRAELKGYLDLNRPTPADWSPRWFVESVKGLYLEDKEITYQYCKKFTNDDFQTYKARMNDTEYAGHPILQNYRELEASFDALIQHVRNLPKEVATGTDWHAGEGVNIEGGGFGASFSYHADIDVADYRDVNNLVDKNALSMGLDTGFRVDAKAFDINVPLISAGLDFDSKDGVHLPLIRVIDFDLLNIARDYALDQIGVDSDLVDLVEDPVQYAEDHVADFDLALESYDKELVSFEFSMYIPVIVPIYIVIRGGLTGHIGVSVGSDYETFESHPLSLTGTIKPYAIAKAFLEGGLSAIIAEISVRSNVTVVDISLPLDATMELSNNRNDPGDLKLGFVITGSSDIDLLSGNIKAKMCVGVWPFELCHRKTLYEWDAAIQEKSTFFELKLNTPVSLRDVILAETLLP